MPVSSLRDFLAERTKAGNELSARAYAWYRSQLLVYRLLIIAAAVAGLVIGVLVLVFHRHVVGALIHVSNVLEQLRWGAPVLFTAIFFVGFPPLLGFSALSMLCGMVYGFPYGWPLLAAASILGSLALFLVFRYLLRRRAEQMVQKHEKFRAFAEILNEEASLVLLVLLRLCPLPYLLSNGALAAVPSLPALTYFLASVITSPKMLIHVFVGHTIKNLGDAGRPTSAKVLDLVSIALTGVAVLAASYIIYNRMQRKLASYHERGFELVYGHFDDDLESGDVELNVGDFDEDNFIIEEPEDAKRHDERVLELGHEPADVDPTDLDVSDLDRPSKAYRDY